MKLKTPANMKAGKYSIECDDGTTTKKLENIFTVYAVGSIVVSSVSPTTLPINKETNLTMTGTGFSDTGKILFLLDPGSITHTYLYLQDRIL